MSKLLDLLSEYLAHRKGLLPLIGIVLIVVNLDFAVLILAFLVDNFQSSASHRADHRDHWIDAGMGIVKG
jgi:hypothetical protein